ncbi:MAG: 4-hydroxy-tetrahydrodipicolinate reductase [Planctomycetes bacterium]|nr:4-hydroxy-tetrahydrodipicolinate reductase [Planctomycetota bacterium]
MRITVHGAAGAMGRRVIALVAATEDMELAGATDRPGHPDLGRDAGTLAAVDALGVPISEALATDCDVVVDFSAPEATLRCARRCMESGTPLVIGTTGLSDAQREEIERQVAASIPVLMAPNMSVGVNLLFSLAEGAARALPEGYDVEVIEAHHRRKKDAPSGTAEELVRRLREVPGRGQGTVRHGRQGAVGPRPPAEIGVHAIRGGDIVGEHTVMFAGEGERIELTHRASSRDVFARGALEAAKFLAGQEAGFYTMQDVLA